MNIPEGMTEEEVLAVIDVVIGRVYKKYTFYGFEPEDIWQEAFIICVDALNRYKDGYPLENFLSFNLSRRLKNFIRDNHFNKMDNEDKKNIKMPGQLSNEEMMHHYEDDAASERMHIAEIKEIIDIHLPYENRADYLKLINNESLPKKQREHIVGILKDIVESYGYETNENGPNI